MAQADAGQTDERERMGEVMDLEAIRKEMRLKELKEELPDLNTALMQMVTRLRDEVELDHRLKGALGLRTTKSVFADGLEVEYTLENVSIDIIRKIVALRFKGYRIEDIPESELGPYLMTAMEIFITESGHPAKTFTAAPDGITDTIGYVQDIVPMVFVNQNPNLITNFGGFGNGAR